MHFPNFFNLMFFFSIFNIPFIYYKITLWPLNLNVHAKLEKMTNKLNDVELKRFHQTLLNIFIIVDMLIISIFNHQKYQLNKNSQKTARNCR